MKKVDKKQQLAYQDVFLYTRITRNFIDTSFSANVSTPFKYQDNTPLDIYTDDDVIVGTVERNLQRDRLFNSRGKLIIIFSESEKHKRKVVGKWNKVKNEVTLYSTEKLEPEEIKVLCLLQKHLTENDIKVIIDIDEKKRFRLETRRRLGDRVRHIPREH